MSIFIAAFLGVIGCKHAPVERNDYRKVAFEDLLSNPMSYNESKICVRGIYSADAEPVIFKDLESFKKYTPVKGLRIVNKTGRFVNVSHGKWVDVFGVFRLSPDNYVSVYFAEIDEVILVEGVQR
jgi:hypothetical protein